MTPIPGHRITARSVGRGAKLPMLYLRQGVVTPARCPCPLVAECRKLRGPVACEGDGVVVVGKEQAVVRL